MKNYKKQLDNLINDFNFRTGLNAIGEIEYNTPYVSVKISNFIETSDIKKILDYMLFLEKSFNGEFVKLSVCTRYNIIQIIVPIKILEFFT